jgi:hypothetical protein
MNSSKHHRLRLAFHCCRQPNRGYRFDHRMAMDDELESIVVEDDIWHVVGNNLEFVDRGRPFAPAPALQGDCGGSDVPAAIMNCHAECLALTGQRNPCQHEDVPIVEQAVVDVPRAQYGMLQLTGQRVLGANASADGPLGWVGIHDAMSSALVGVDVAT